MTIQLTNKHGNQTYVAITTFKGRWVYRHSDKPAVISPCQVVWFFSNPARWSGFQVSVQ